ncbi:hypothetical protein Pth03_67580 [Planotetraspora thailandica]|uniref:Uncharacterized protein n=1 Tax=Planotetraspora thailandica TaxID=487172 RepID=A0A8J3Y057_9ACTN|nr:hypothetical protein [Planotetraspora thailandica]GII58369.1 hypothetical protein Pth03_67580 [Planotetraspora thailandica]
MSDIHGARLLGRLLWGLAYQRRPGTLVVIGPQHLDSSPFDAEPADPIALVPSHLTTLPARAATSLRLRGSPTVLREWAVDVARAGGQPGR